MFTELLRVVICAEVIELLCELVTGSGKSIKLIERKECH